MIKFDTIVQSPLGIHANPAAMLVHKTRSLSSRVMLCYKDKQVNAKDIILILTLNVQEKAVITFLIEGENEQFDAEQLKAYCINNI